MLPSSSRWKSTSLAYGSNNNICRGGIVFLSLFVKDMRLLWLARLLCSVPQNVSIPVALFPVSDLESVSS